MGEPFQGSSTSNMGNEATHQGPRAVVRTACLNCRSAKRRCDGVTPMCGPCAARGVEKGGCHFVTSKRGGPRFKGVSGKDAVKVKATRDSLREISKSTRTSGKHQQKASKSSDSQYTSPDSSDHAMLRSNLGSPYDDPFFNVQMYSGVQMSYPQGSLQEFIQPSSSDTQAQVYSSAYPQNVSPSYSSMLSVDSTILHPERHAHQMLSYHSAPQINSQEDHHSSGNSTSSSSVAPGSNEYHQPFADPSASASNDRSLFSFAGVGMWNNVQQHLTEAEQESYSDFLRRLDSLPKTGFVDTSSTPCNPMDVFMEWEGATIGGNMQGNEQSVRIFLSEYYELVYPACPVLPSSEVLPSLAFFFSGMQPCGLFAALCAVVCLHLPREEACKTLKANHDSTQTYEGARNGLSTNGEVLSEGDSSEDIAAYHVRSAELLIHRWEQNQDTCFRDPTAVNLAGDLDRELIAIEKGATHVLLCHYYYGTHKPVGHQRAYKHAIQAWKEVQKVDISGESWQDDTLERTNSSRPFAKHIKMEWVKRVRWCSYTAASVMSCTGGFEPFDPPAGGEMKLYSMPSLESDPNAWSVFARGAQNVSKCYRLLYELDRLRHRAAETSVGVLEAQQIHLERQAIFNAMLKLDAGIVDYMTNDPIWTQQHANGQSENAAAKTSDRELACALQTTGRLMTSGATILLHRAQAFANALVFMNPQCGIPEASRPAGHKTIDPIVHLSVEVKLSDDAKGTGRQHQSESKESPSEVTHPKLSGTRGTSLLTDKYAGGPFEPHHSIERCRIASNSIAGTLWNVLQDECPIVRLPPFSACSYVLGAYAMLMLTLLTQIRGEIALHQHSKGSPAYIRHLQSLQQHVDEQRAPVHQIIATLNKFSYVWARAREYKDEVSTLLEANKTLT